MENIKLVSGGASKVFGIALTALVLVAIIYVAALAVNEINKGKYIGRDAVGQSTISVSGEGEVYAKPDLAVMDFSVVSEGKTVAEALKDNTTKMNAMIQVAKGLGVGDKDLKTMNFSVSPRYDYVKSTTITNPATPGIEPGMGVNISAISSYSVPESGKRVLSGYDITQTLEVKMRNLDKVGDIIQAVTAEGANQSGDLQFTIDNPEGLQGQARAQAIEKAKAQAGVLAKQLGVKLVRILNYNENNYPYGGYGYAAKAVAMDSAVAVPAPQIQAGQSKITSSVNLTYEIEQ